MRRCAYIRQRTARVRPNTAPFVIKVLWHLAPCEVEAWQAFGGGEGRAGQRIAVHHQSAARRQRRQQRRPGPHDRPFSLALCVGCVVSRDGRSAGVNSCA